MMCLGVCFLGSSFFGTLWAWWTSWKSISLARLGKFSFIICSNKFSLFCSFSSPSDTPINQMLEYLKMSWSFLSLSSFSWILVSSFFSGWMFPFFLLVHTVDLSPGFLPSTVGSLYVFLYFTLHSLLIFLSFVTILNHFCEHPDYSLLNTASDG